MRLQWEYPILNSNYSKGLEMMWFTKFCLCKYISNWKVYWELLIDYRKHKERIFWQVYTLGIGSNTFGQIKKTLLDPA